MTVLITGAGMIGRETARLLRSRGDSVVLADIAMPVDASATGAVTVRCDILDIAALRDLVRRHGITRIVHTAANYIITYAMRKAHRIMCIISGFEFFIISNLVYYRHHILWSSNDSICGHRSSRSTCLCIH